MKNSVLLAATLLALTAGASATAADTQTQDAKQQKAQVCRATGPTTTCKIVVRVAKCVVTVDPYFLVVVPRRTKGSDGPDPITMEWTIEGKGTFASENGIRWKSPEGNRVFTPVEPGARSGEAAPAPKSKEAMVASRPKPGAAPAKAPAKSGQQIAFSNSGTKGVYNYGVRVVSATGERCPELDPTGINDMPQ